MVGGGRGGAAWCGGGRRAAAGVNGRASDMHMCDSASGGARRAGVRTCLIIMIIVIIIIIIIIFQMMQMMMSEFASCHDVLLGRWPWCVLGRGALVCRSLSAGATGRHAELGGERAPPAARTARAARGWEGTAQQRGREKFGRLSESQGN